MMAKTSDACLHTKSLVALFGRGRLGTVEDGRKLGCVTNNINGSHGVQLERPRCGTRWRDVVLKNHLVVRL